MRERSSRGSRPMALQAMALVAKLYRVPVADLKGRGRTDEVAFARHLAMYLCYTLGRLSLVEVGRLFNRHPQTVWKSSKLIEETRGEVLEFEAQVLRMIHELTGVVVEEGEGRDEQQNLVRDEGVSAANSGQPGVSQLGADAGQGGRPPGRGKAHRKPPEG